MLRERASWLWTVCQIMQFINNSNNFILGVICFKTFLGYGFSFDLLYLLGLFDHIVCLIG